MAYIGQNADGNFTTSVSKDTFSGNGSTTAFTLSEGATTNTVDVFVENIRQEPTTAYTVDGTTLTFTAAPVTGTNNIYVVNRGPIQLSASHPAAQALTAHSATITTDLTVDTNTLFVDSTNNNVGIGTSSPNSYTGFTVLTLNNATNGAEIDFEKNGTVQGSIFTPASADDFTITAAHASGDLIFQAGGYTERMRIDSSGDIMAGTTSEVQGDSSGTGLYYDVSKGALQLKASGNVPIVANRVGSDGIIAQFRKDGTTVGSIEIDSGGFLIDGEANHTGLIFGGGAIAPRLNGSSADNTVNLGISSQRFENLFLGGGVYLGGTGSANALDDYEEGDFTPTYVFSSGGGSFSYSIQVGKYTKIGRFVFAQVRIRGQKSGTGSGVLQIAGLPFTALNVTNLFGTAAIGFTNNWNNRPMGAYIEANNTAITLTKGANSSNTYSDLDTTIVNADLDTGSTSSNDLILTICFTT